MLKNVVLETRIFIFASYRKGGNTSGERKFLLCILRGVVLRARAGGVGILPRNDVIAGSLNSLVCIFHRSCIRVWKKNYDSRYRVIE